MVMIRSEVGQMIQNEDENQAFHRRVGEILRIAVNVEEDLDFFIANYFCTPQSYKTFLLKDLWLVERTGFGRKINIFKKICKEEKIDEKRVNGIVGAMNFVIEKRNMAAHGEAFVYDKEEGIKLQTRKSMKKKEQELKVTDDLVKQIDEKGSYAKQEIVNLYLELSNPSREKDNDW